MNCWNQLMVLCYAEKAIPLSLLRQSSWNWSCIENNQRWFFGMLSSPAQVSGQLFCLLTCQNTFLAHLAGTSGEFQHHKEVREFPHFGQPHLPRYGSLQALLHRKGTRHSREKRYSYIPPTHIPLDPLVLKTPIHTEIHLDFVDCVLGEIMLLPKPPHILSIFQPEQRQVS